MTFIDSNAVMMGSNVWSIVLETPQTLALRVESSAGVTSAKFGPVLTVTVLYQQGVIVLTKFMVGARVG
jgi:hypothetical protein